MILARLSGWVSLEVDKPSQLAGSTSHSHPTEGEWRAMPAARRADDIVTKYARSRPDRYGPHVSEFSTTRIPQIEPSGETFCAQSRTGVRLRERHVRGDIA